jgi:hypothetical protein
MAAEKICPPHTPAAAKFFGGDSWKKTYVVQRLAAYRCPDNLLSEFHAWVLRQLNQSDRMHYLATYASTGDFDNRSGIPHDGGIYRATNAVYCGMTDPSRKKVEGYVLNGEFNSLRKGPKTMRVPEIPPEARLVYAAPSHRYCWAIGRPVARAFRLRKLKKRMKRFTFVPAYQPRLLTRIWQSLVLAFMEATNETQK